MRMPARSTVRACKPRFNEAVKQDMHADLTNLDLFRHIPGLSLGPEFFAFSLTGQNDTDIVWNKM